VIQLARLPEDLELSPFNQHGGLGKAHQLFGEQLPRLFSHPICKIAGVDTVSAISASLPPIRKGRLRP
jgi:hypothetical protein